MNRMQDEKTNTKDIFPVDTYRQQYSRFIEMAAHDLQAPLRKLGVLTDMLTNKYKSVKDDEVDQYTRRIHTCIENMRSLIEGFTELAEAIPETMHFENCDTAKVIKRILEESTSQIKIKEADIRIGEMPVIQGDKIQLRLLFKNLLENSFRFSKPGSPLKIDISSDILPGSEKKRFHLNEKKSYYKICVEDNGMGMKPGDIEKIFFPLIRLHGKAEFPGNGLGLALVKKIMENHKGIVYAESTQDKGVSIILIIPENQD